MTGKVIKINESLYFKNEYDNDNLLLVKNAYKCSDGGFHQVSGWHIYSKPLDLNEIYEFDIEDEMTCRIIRVKNE